MNTKKILAKMQLGLPLTWKDTTPAPIVKNEQARRILGLV